jgi:hypothetical protein
MAKQSEAQKRASEKWDAENRAHRNYLTRKNSAKSFVRDSKGASANEPTYIDDLKELRTMIDDKLNS